MEARRGRRSALATQAREGVGERGHRRRGCGARRRPRSSRRATRVGIASATVTKVAASSWFHSPRRLAISQAASGRNSARQLGDRVRQDAEDQFEAGDVELVGERRALEAEVERLGAEREEGDGADEEDRQLAGLDVDPAREPGPLRGGDRHRGAGDEAGDAGGGVQGEDQRVAPEDRQQVAGLGGLGQARQVDRASGPASAARRRTRSRPAARARSPGSAPASRAAPPRGARSRPQASPACPRIPCENTCWLTALIAPSSADPGHDLSACRSGSLFPASEFLLANLRITCNYV